MELKKKKSTLEKCANKCSILMIWGIYVRLISITALGTS